MEEPTSFGGSGALMTARENPRDTPRPARAWSSSTLVVLITAAGLQGEQPLVDRTMWVREVGKTDP